VNVSDVSLVDFIGVKGKFAVWLPHTAGRYQAKSFRKVQCPIVERLITAMMFHGRNNGKKQMAQKIVKHSGSFVLSSPPPSPWLSRTLLRLRSSDAGPLRM